jgi:hypothetical protein
MDIFAAINNPTPLSTSSDVIGVVHTPIKEVWRVVDALSNALVSMAIANPPMIVPSGIVGGGIPVPDEARKIFHSMNSAPTNENHYIRPSKAVNRPTPTFTVIPSPKVVMFSYTVPVGSALVPVTVNVHFECDRDFSEQLPGDKLVLTWETKDNKYGLIEHHVSTIAPSLSTMTMFLASYLDGVGYLNVDQGLIKVGRGVTF